MFPVLTDRRPRPSDGAGHCRDRQKAGADVKKSPNTLQYVPRYYLLAVKWLGAAASCCNEECGFVTATIVLFECYPALIQGRKQMFEQLIKIEEPQPRALEVNFLVFHGFPKFQVSF